MCKICAAIFFISDCCHLDKQLRPSAILKFYGNTQGLDCSFPISRCSMSATGKPVRRLTASQHSGMRKDLLLLKVAMISMVSMGILFGTYFVSPSSQLVLLPWIIFILCASYVTKEYFFSIRKNRRTVRHCLQDTKDAGMVNFRTKELSTSARS